MITFFNPVVFLTFSCNIIIVKLKALLELTRIDHGIMLSFAVIVAFLILGIDPLSLPIPILLSSLLVPLLIEVGAFSLNDYLDYNSDKLNNRQDRPLVRGDLSRNTALYIFVFSFVIAVLMSFLLPRPALYIVIAFAFLSISYDISLKHLPLLGNVIIALSMAIPFIFANSIVSNQTNEIILIIFSMVLFLGIAREIIKDIEDMEGDKEAASSRTLPIVIGVKNSSLVAGLFLLIFMVIAAIPFVFYLDPNAFSIVFLLLSYLFVGYSAGASFFLINEDNYKYIASKLKKYLFFSMILGLIALLLAV